MAGFLCFFLGLATNLIAEVLNDSEFDYSGGDSDEDPEFCPEINQAVLDHRNNDSSSSSKDEDDVVISAASPAMSEIRQISPLQLRHIYQEQEDVQQEHFAGRIAVVAVVEVNGYYPLDKYLLEVDKITQAFKILGYTRLLIQKSLVLCNLLTSTKILRNDSGTSFMSNVDSDILNYIVTCTNSTQVPANLWD